MGDLEDWETQSVSSDKLGLRIEFKLRQGSIVVLPLICLFAAVELVRVSVYDAPRLL